MAASLQPWNDPFNGLPVDDIEEGLLDETCDTTQKFQETSTAFPRTTEHGWKELVSDPSLGEVDILERSRAQEQDAKVTVGRKDWDHYLSAFSVNDEDSAKFVALELHSEQGDGFGVSTSADLGEDQEKNFSKGSTFGVADVTGGVVDSAVLAKVSDFTATKNSVGSKGGENQDAIIHESSSRNSSHASGDSSFLARTDIKQSSAPNAMFTSSKNLPLDSDMFAKVGGGAQASHRRARSALDSSHDAFTYLPKWSSFTPRATSAPLWEGEDADAVTTSTDFQTGKAPSHVDELREERRTKMDDWESSLEQRKISGADENTCDIPRSSIKGNPSGEAIKDGSLKREFITYSTTKASFLKQETDSAGEIAGEEATVPIKDFSHPFGDGKRSEDIVKGSFASKSNSKVGGKDLEMEWLSEDSDRHSIVGSGSGVVDAIEKGDSDLSDDLKTNPPSSDTPKTSNRTRLEHAEGFTDAPNVATSREAAENLPIRPLTIGDSLNIGSTVAYRPISPFLADRYSPGATSYDPGVPSATSATTPHLSASQYSEGGLDADEDGGGGDMSALERLQPLGRDGLEVKQGPPWGITMPLFQPSSRDSSLSSNDSNASTSQFHQLQATSPEHSKQEIEPLLSRSSTPSEPDLSRKASVKSLEPKEPMGVKMMTAVDNLKTPIRKFHQLNSADGDSPVSKILGPTFKATQKMLEELQRKPLGAYDEDSDQPSVGKTEITNEYESETPVDWKTLAAGKRFDSERDVGQESGNLEESFQNAGSRYAQDKRSSQNRRSSDVGRSSREKVEKHSRDSYQEDSINLRTPESSHVTTTASGVLSSRRVSGMDDVEKPRNSRPSSRENEVEKSTRNSSRGSSIIRGTSDITPTTATSLVATNDTRTPDASDSHMVKNSRPSSRENEKKPTRDSYYGSFINQPTVEIPLLTTSQTGIVYNTRSSEANDVKRLQSERLSSRWNENKLDTTILRMDVENVARSSPADAFQVSQDSGHSSSGRKVEKPSRDAVHQFSKDQNSLGSTRIPSQTHGPIVSLRDDTPRRLANDVVGSQSRRNESHKTSGMTDSTLGNSVPLSGHLVAAGAEPEHEGSAREIGRPEIFQSQNLMEDRNDASDLSEFDRVASESISWSNALANQFRAEMRSADIEFEERLQGPGNEQAFEKLTATSSRQDSGLSESSTNDEVYRPKQLARLSSGNRPIGVYDVRQSSGPGSTNRKRLALGKKPRESSTSWLNDGIYVSDGTAGTSGTDKDHQEKTHQSRHRVHRDTYVSEGTASGTERVDNGIDSGPEEQSTPKSEDISARQNISLKTKDFSCKESNMPATDTYFGLTSFEPKVVTNQGRSSFTTYDIEKPPQQSLSAFMNYRKDMSQSPFSTFDIDKPTRANPPGTSKYEIVTRGDAEFSGKASVAPKEGGSVTRPQKAAKVEYTWSISKPVMSQLVTRAAASDTRDHGGELRTSTIRQQQHRPPSSEQRPSRQPGSRRNRAIRQKEASRQHEKDRPSPSMESEMIQERSGTSKGRKKSVADIILENMIQDEQEQKKRQKKLEMKQEQATQDLNHLWERFQDVFGKKSRASRDTKNVRAVRARPPREATPSDISPVSSSDASSAGSRSISRQSLEITTDTDEEFERFLHRIREIQSSESSYAEDMRSISSRASSSEQHFTRDKHEATPSDRLPGKHRPKTVDSSASLASTATLDDERARRNESRTATYERPSRKTNRQNIDGPLAVPSSVANAKSISPATMIPMWLSAKNKEMTKMGKTSTSTCTCGAKSKKERPKPSGGVRDIGVNCPTPPMEAQDIRLPVAADIAVLRDGPSEEDVPRSAPASLVKLSLQDAFAISKQEFIERSRERLKKVNQIRDDRKNEKRNGEKVIVVVPSERIKQAIVASKPEEDRIADMKSNKRFEQLQRKKPRPMTTREIRDVNKRVYKNLPEVRKKRDEERRAEFYKTNRLRAQLYGKNKAKNHLVIWKRHI